MQERKPQKPTINQLIRETSTRLEAVGIDTARLEAELIWSHALQLPRLKLLTEPNLEIESRLAAEAEAIIRRRTEREPLQHILGEAHFYGLTFEVTPDVLVPRPETELLVEHAVEYLKDRGGTDFFELGTGTGCIPIAIVATLEHCRATTVDISRAATAIARANAERHGVQDRIEFLSGSGFDALEPGREFDLIASNPPYIPTAELEKLPPEVRDHDPTLALDGGRDGLSFYRRLALEGEAWLKPAGVMMVELGHDQAAAVRELFESEMWIVDRVIDDYSRIPRILIAHPAGVAGDNR